MITSVSDALTPVKLTIPLPIWMWYVTIYYFNIKFISIHKWLSKMYVNYNNTFLTICMWISLKTRTYFEFQSLTNVSVSFSYTLLRVHSNTHMTWNIEANKCQIKCYGTNFTLDNYGKNIVGVTVRIVRYHAIRSQHNPINKTTCQDNSFLFAFTPRNLTKTLEHLFEILAHHQNIFKHKYLKNLTCTASGEEGVNHTRMHICYIFHSKVLMLQKRKRNESIASKLNVQYLALAALRWSTLIVILFPIPPTLIPHFYFGQTNPCTIRSQCHCVKNNESWRIWGFT